MRSRRPRKPRVYRIPVETYLIVLAVAFALAIAFSLLSGDKEIHYRLSHRFGVEEETFLPSSHALSNPYPATGNRIRVLENGDEIYPAMLAAIAGARRSINLELRRAPRRRREDFRVRAHDVSRQDPCR